MKKSFGGHQEGAGTRKLALDGMRSGSADAVRTETFEARGIKKGRSPNSSGTTPVFRIMKACEMSSPAKTSPKSCRVFSTTSCGAGFPCCAYTGVIDSVNRHKSTATG
ncbi:MAG TPA: hypothetical protein VG778_10890 [Blastocatellia bacterium]|nr:hypothetical protein [Blastocatellia bacterium]